MRKTTLWWCLCRKWEIFKHAPRQIRALQSDHFAYMRSQFYFRNTRPSRLSSPGKCMDSSQQHAWCQTTSLADPELVMQEACCFASYGFSSLFSSIKKAVTASYSEHFNHQTAHKACLMNANVPLCKLNPDFVKRAQKAHHQATTLRRSTVQDIQINKPSYKGQFVRRRKKWNREKADECSTLGDLGHTFRKWLPPA